MCGIDINNNKIALSSLKEDKIFHLDFSKYFDKIKEIKSRLLKSKDEKEKKMLQRRLNKIRQKALNYRNNILHNISKYIVKNYKTIVIEDINFKEITKNVKSSTKFNFLYNNLRKFLDFLYYKSKLYNASVVKVDRFYKSTKLCSNCQSVNDISMQDRVYNCKSCNISIDRDINAARNLLIFRISKRVYYKYKKDNVCAATAQ